MVCLDGRNRAELHIQSHHVFIFVLGGFASREVAQLHVVTEGGLHLLRAHGKRQAYGAPLASLNGAKNTHVHIRGGLWSRRRILVEDGTRVGLLRDGDGRGDDISLFRLVFFANKDNVLNRDGIVAQLHAGIHVHDDRGYLAVADGNVGGRSLGQQTECAVRLDGTLEVVELVDAGLAGRHQLVVLVGHKGEAFRQVEVELDGLHADGVLHANGQYLLRTGWNILALHIDGVRHGRQVCFLCVARRDCHERQQ